MGVDCLVGLDHLVGMDPSFDSSQSWFSTVEISGLVGMDHLVGMDPSFDLKSVLVQHSRNILFGRETGLEVCPHG